MASLANAVLCKSAAFAASTSRNIRKPECPDILYEVVPLSLLEPDWVLDGNDVDPPSARSSHVILLVAEPAASSQEALLLPDCDVIVFVVAPDTIALEPDPDGNVRDEAPPAPERVLTLKDEVGIGPLPVCSPEPDPLDDLTDMPSAALLSSDTVVAFSPLHSCCLPLTRSLGTSLSPGACNRFRQH